MSPGLTKLPPNNSSKPTPLPARLNQALGGWLALKRIVMQSLAPVVKHGRNTGHFGQPCAMRKDQAARR
jgi:hypothetical protein